GNDGNNEGSGGGRPPNGRSDGSNSGPGAKKSGEPTESEGLYPHHEHNVMDAKSSADRPCSTGDMGPPRADSAECGIADHRGQRTSEPSLDYLELVHLPEPAGCRRDDTTLSSFHPSAV